MPAQRIKTIQDRIKQIKRELAALGDMRPGTLSKQYNVCGKKTCRCKDPVNPRKHGPYFQLSYTHGRKSTSQFIKEKFVWEITQQTANYKRFKALTEEWVSLSIQASRLKMQIKEKGAKP